MEGKTPGNKGRSSHEWGEDSGYVLYKNFKRWEMFLGGYSDTLQTREQGELENEPKQK